MKINILFFIITISQSINAQVSLQNNSLIHPKLAVLYIGMDNKIKVIGLKNYAELTITSTNSYKSKYIIDSNGTATITVNTTGIDTLKLYKKNKLIATHYFKVQSIEYPVIRVGQISDTIASKQQILKQAKLNVVIPNCEYDFKIKVVKFSMTIITHYNGVSRVELNQISSNVLSQDYIDAILSLDKGDKIIFDNVVIQGESACRRMIAGCSLLIK